MIIFFCKDKHDTGSLITAWFVMSNFLVFFVMEYFLQYTYKAKYEEYRHHFEIPMRDLESIALMQAALLAASFLHLLLYD